MANEDKYIFNTNVLWWQPPQSDIYKLIEILNDEFPGSSREDCAIYQTQGNPYDHMQYPFSRITFTNQEDLTAFILKYGHIFK